MMLRYSKTVEREIRNNPLILPSGDGLQYCKGQSDITKDLQPMFRRRTKKSAMELVFYKL